MLRLSLDLPKYRLQVRLAKRRGPLFEKSLLPDIEEIKNTRSGNKVSRFFRHVFEHNKIRKVLGSTLAVVFFAGTLFPAKAGTIRFDQEATTLAVNQDPLKTQPGVRYPLSSVKINQGFFIFHPALDLGGEVGDPIYPVMSGTVEAIQNYKNGADSEIESTLYGNAIIVNHGNGITSLYAHLSKIDVSRGQEVTTATELGEVGITGHSTGPHLHLEIRDHGIPINPFSVLPK